MDDTGVIGRNERYASGDEETEGVDGDWAVFVLGCVPEDGTKDSFMDMGNVLGGNAGEEGTGKLWVIDRGSSTDSGSSGKELPGNSVVEPAGAFIDEFAYLP